MLTTGRVTSRLFCNLHRWTYFNIEPDRTIDEKMQLGKVGERVTVAYFYEVPLHLGNAVA
jgi:hypothetical protein